MMGLPAAVVVAIEGIKVKSGGVRVVSVRPSPLSPDKTKWLTITVEAGQGRHTSARVATQDLADHSYVVGVVADACYAAM